MKRSSQRAMMVGLCLALAAGAEGCELSLGARPCGGDWCPATMICVDDARCVVPGLCGNALVDPGEQCDDGNTRDGDGCSAYCQIERCGNQTIDQGEVCDDGNTRDGDGCGLDCKSTEVCGNAILDVAAGEVCDDGARNGTPGDPCSADCRHYQPCNDGIVGPGEECDHGGLSPGNPTGNDNSNDCRADCQFNRCGDSFIDTQPGSRQEECDDGHLTGLIPHPTETAGCNIDCTRARCGDGKVNQSAGEQCDDGNTSDGDGCSSTCQIEH